jgi:hypothetical protein
LFVSPAVAAYFLLAWHLDFYQDDAFITYRYVANYLNGDGLVFNIGERVEGYTNFGWVVWLACWGVMGFSYVMISKITGYVLGALIVYITFLLAKKVTNSNGVWGAVIAASLVGINQSLAYWSPAGLETAAFALMATLSLYLYLNRNWLLIATLTYAVLIRPEGALLAAILVVTDFIHSRRVFGFALRAALIAFVFTLPMLGFKLAYYGAILPNPFYAKTGFAWSQLSNGVEYAGRFFSHYGFYGVPLLIPLLFWRSLSRNARSLWMFTVFYCVYIILVGGDVLKVHRFFLPVFASYAILVVVSITSLVRRIRKRRQLAVLVLASVPLLVLTYYLPRDFVESFNTSEKTFIRKMWFKAKVVKQTDTSDFSVALPTIGVFGYELVGHRVIDMLGLTDSTIARHSEAPIPGMETTWKETKHNSVYLLEQAPDYILFSTEVKPSAPAEKALLLYPQFHDAYKKVGWYYEDTVARMPGALTVAFKKMRPVTGPFEPAYPLEVVDEYKLGIEAFARGDARTAWPHFNRALAASPQPYFSDILYHRAWILSGMGREAEAESLLHNILEQDSLVFGVHRQLYAISTAKGDTASIELHRRWLNRLVPWYLPMLDSALAGLVPRR